MRNSELLMFCCSEVKVVTRWLQGGSRWLQGGYSLLRERSWRAFTRRPSVGGDLGHKFETPH